MKKSFKVDKNNIGLIDFLSSSLIFIPKDKIKRQLSLKEIKVNGKRTGENIMLKKGDNVEIFLPQSMTEDEPQIRIVYEDENILVADKPILCDTENHLVNLLKKEGKDVKAVHRLDMNTQGLVMFALNDDAYNELTDAIKKGGIIKTYSALVLGIPKVSSGVLTAYLKKDSVNSHCYVSKEPQNGYKKIITEYEVSEKYESYSKLSIKLITGRTHQIRAHMAYIGHPVLGDNKYGDTEANKKFNYKFQQLIAEKITFLSFKGKLNYLNDSEIKR